MPYKNKTKARAFQRRWYKEHKEQAKESFKKWNSKPKAKARRWEAHLNLLGWTTEEYNEAKRKQRSRCFICRKEKKLVADHCHKTGKKRALICWSCNTGIGQFSDDPRFMMKAVKYLRKFEAKNAR